MALQTARRISFASMGKIVYITGNAPFNRGEEFVLTEMLALQTLGVDLLIIPRDGPTGTLHGKAKGLLKNTLSMPLIDLKIGRACLKYIVSHPFIFFEILKSTVLKARNFKIGLKNMAILPKSLYICQMLEGEDVSHVHAHWASTPSTIAYIISKVTALPWSFTAHRWDIGENNVLQEKCRTASFVRAISEQGRDAIRSLIKDNSLSQKIIVLHMGVEVERGRHVMKTNNKSVTFVCPANLLPVKGHRYLFEACRMLLERKIPFKCFLAGDGQLERELRRFVVDHDLGDNIQFLGRVAHERLLELYRGKEVDAVILPSIKTEDGEEEGIPVSLMEAMSHGIPVISTNTGGIAELIGDGSGIMVEEQNPGAIADAVAELVNDAAYARSTGLKGKDKIAKDFDLAAISRRLLQLFLLSREHDLLQDRSIAPLDGSINEYSAH